MEAKRSYHAPRLQRITEGAAALRLMLLRKRIVLALQPGDRHAEAYHLLLKLLLDLAKVERWHRYRGVWCRLVDTADERGHQQTLPANLAPLADIIEGCR